MNVRLGSTVAVDLIVANVRVVRRGNEVIGQGLGHVVVDLMGEFRVHNAEFIMEEEEPETVDAQLTVLLTF